MAQRYEALIFDLWGTLIHPTILSVDVICRLAGVPYDDFLPAWTENRVRRETGPLKNALVDLFGQLGISLDNGILPRALDAHARLQTRALKRSGSNAVTVLRTVGSLGLRIGLVSNCTSDMASCFHDSGIGRQVDAAAFSSDLGVMKPDVRLYQHVCRLLDVVPTQCMYVGDGGDQELAGAAAAGMDPVLLSTSRNAWPGRQIARLEHVVEFVTSPRPVRGNR